MLKSTLEQLAQSTRGRHGDDSGQCEQRCSELEEQIVGLQAQVASLQEQRTILKENHALHEEQWKHTLKKEATADYLTQLKGPLGEALRDEVRRELRQSMSGELSEMKAELEKEMEEAVWQVSALRSRPNPSPN